MNKLPPKAFYSFFVTNVIGFLFLFGFLEFLFIMVAIAVASDGDLTPLIFIPPTLLVCLALPFGLAYPLAKLAYDNFGYQIGDEVITVKSGAVIKRNTSIPYGRVQNVDIVQGIVSQMLGLADLQIQTAGISGVNLVEGRIPAVTPEEADFIKASILAKIDNKGGGL